jgi:hypothetical protein
MKKIVSLIAAMVASLVMIGCDSGGSTTVQPSTAAVTVEPSKADVGVTVEPAPVEIVIINGEPEPTPTALFGGIRDAYFIDEGVILTTVTMLDNEGINLFNFLFVIEYFDGDIFYSEPNAEREDGRITVRDNFTMKKPGRYIISLFYYGDKDVQITKKAFDL